MKFENISVYNIANAMRGMRNPLMSHDRGDTYATLDAPGLAVIGPKDRELAKRLIMAGVPHRKFLRQIFVSVDITAPGYWWTEADTYKVGTTRDSSSTMHRIASRPVSVEDFAESETEEESSDLRIAVDVLNRYRNRYVELKESKKERDAEKYFRAMKRMLPQSYLYLSTWTANYEILANMYEWRKSHRLPEWHSFCDDFIRKLPYCEFITGEFQS